MRCRRRAMPSTSSCSTPAATIRWPGSQSTRGLSRVDSSSSLFVSFSTSPGEVALDGAGRNSPYTKHLNAVDRHRPTSTLEDTFKRTLKGVYQETGGKQQPWISSSFFGEFMFQPGASAPAALPPPRSSRPARSAFRRGWFPAARSSPGTVPALARHLLSPKAPTRTAAATAAWSR